ncbi:MAG: alkane 1-monooxygenase [Myxococcales bacterium]|nr:alkane 1-monooxygenase [Myxococcales bacterium]
MAPFHYSAFFLVPALALLGFAFGGLWLWMAPLVVFGLIPLAELLLPAPTHNPEPEAVRDRLKNWRYDAIIYTTIPVQTAVLFAFFYWLIGTGPSGAAYWGGILSAGICCGELGINIGHELGHRTGKLDQFLAKYLLSTSLYAHFFIEHNRGHHAMVATHEDPASARRGEWLQTFWLRSMAGGWMNAWRLEFDRCRRRNQAIFGWHNEMLRLQVVQGMALVFLTWALGLAALFAFAAAALVGALLLETVNYLEHYGLSRSQDASGRWSKVEPAHSWNSNCLLGRLLLFELTRHSDHHAHPRRPYPVLRHFDEAPQLPTGYPGMIVVALFPPLFFALMHARLDAHMVERAEAIPVS